MMRIVCVVCCILGLTIPIVAQTRQPAPSQPSRPASTYDPARQPGLYRQTWYDAMLRQFNPDNLNWGHWLEQRRQIFLEETAANPSFKYGLVTTLLVILLAIAFTKALIDKSRMKWLAQERYSDLRRHDQSSRRVAREAIRKYNDHMEKCNRVVEAEMVRQPVIAESAISPATKDIPLTLDEALIGLADVKRERDSMAAKLDRTNAVVGELTMRVSEVQGGGRGAGSDNGHAQDGSPRTDLVKQINELREQLYRERERNKHLKGM